ncbi:MAG: DUF262 domain-containing protein, partial [Candidatus Omnitrophica bacterium]|nr:DUF262 domain-containing protein [Candidatus Omnitrophota bacterium]
MPFELNKDDFTVSNLVEAAEKEQIFLPEFQRQFVWGRDQIKLLIDSLYRKYTINSFLIWKGPDELARRRVGGNVNEICIPGHGEEIVHYILDGQ